MTWLIITIIVLVLIGLWQAWDQWHLRRSLDRAHDAIEELDLTIEEGQAAHDALQEEFNRADSALAYQKAVSVAAAAVIEILAPHEDRRRGRRCSECGMNLGSGVAGHMQDCKYARALDIYMGVTHEISLTATNQRHGPSAVQEVEGTYMLGEPEVEVEMLDTPPEGQAPRSPR